MVELYLPFAVPSVAFAHVSKKFVSAVLLVAVILFQSIVAIILKRKFSRLTYYQQFLLTGLATLYTSFVFLLLSISYVEVSEFWPGYYVIFPAAWLLIVGVNLGWTWWRVKSGYYVGREEGKEPQSLKPGDVVSIPANVKHWHGAKKDSWFSHLAVEVPGENTSNEWCEPVSDEEYNELR